MEESCESCADSFGRMSSGKRCGLLSFCIFLVGFIVYIAVAIDGVEPTEYAIIQNNIDQNINPDLVLEGGLHWVGVFYSLIRFPAIHNSIEFSNETPALEGQQPRLNTRTKEGLDLSVSFAFQHQLIKDKLPKMYRLCEDNHTEIYTKLARNAVLQVAGNWNASNYWLNRT